MGHAIRSLAGGAVAVLVAGCGAAAKEPAEPVAASGTAPGSSSVAAQAVGASTSTTATSAPSGKERTYYIAAEEVLWDYAPSGRDEITGGAFDEGAGVFVTAARDRIGSKYMKCLYRGYSDAGFSSPQERPEADRYMGFLGPTIRAEVGDTVKVVFRNTCSFPTSLHPHGVRYDKDGEGAGYNDGTSGDDQNDDAVPKGGEHTYRWEVPERAGPGPMDGSSAMWMYHSHNDEIADVYAGLSGFLVVTAKGKAKPDGSPADVDREVFSLYEVSDENSSTLADANVERLAAEATDELLEDEEFVESNLMHGINGFVYGNGPTVTMRRGEKVRWYLMGMGTEVDLHTPHWHGNTAVINGMRSDVANLLPASMAVADMTPDAVGTWLFHCHVADHIAAGMVTRYEVKS